MRIGDIVEGAVFKITSFGAFVKLFDGQNALIHISQVSDGFAKNINDYLKLGDKVSARILKIDAGKINLTLKKPKQQETYFYPNGKEFKSSVLEDSLHGYLTQK
jgi:predicted RNA-binding protein with RPS1 domain